MTQEEKAKAYDEALTIAKRIISKNCSEVEKLCLECIFPQLKESEDERIRKILIHIVKGACDKYGIKYKGDEITEEKLLAYLEKQKEPQHAIRATKGFGDPDGPQFELVDLQDEPKQEWSEEEEDKLEQCIRIVRGWEGDYDIVKSPYSNFLKSLRPQPRQEWSEEDEKMLTGIIERGSSQIPSHEPALREDQMEWLMKRLRSLRPSWKPSEEQLEAAQYVSQFDYGGHKAALVSLYEQLKKLM